MIHGQNISQICNVRNSIPLLFTPPKLKDRQIKRDKDNLVRIEIQVSKDNLNEQVEAFSMGETPDISKPEENTAANTGDSAATVTKEIEGYQPEVIQSEKLTNEEASFDEHGAIHEEPININNGLVHCSMNNLPMVKLPILLAIEDIEFDILHVFGLPDPLEKIINVEWTVQSLDVQVHLPATKACINGELTADIEFLQDNETYSSHHLILHIPLDKVVEIEWLYPPDLSSMQQKEYLFKGNDPLHIHTHYERVQKFTDPLDYQLKQLSFVWHQDVLFENQTKMIQFQGTLSLTIHLFQTQLVNLKKDQPFLHL